MEQEKILLQIETELVALRTFIRKLKPDAKIHQLDIDLIKQKAISMYDSVLMLEPTREAVPKATVFDIKKPEPAVVPDKEIDDSMELEKQRLIKNKQAVKAETIMTSEEEISHDVDEPAVTTSKEAPKPVSQPKPEKEVKQQPLSEPSLEEKKTETIEFEIGSSTEEPANNDVETENKATQPETEQQPKPETAPEKTAQTPAQADLFSASPETIADKLSSEKQKTVADKLSHDNQNNLRKFIGINEKFLLINELFNGDLSRYNSAIDELDSMQTAEGANTCLIELQVQNQWDEESDAYVKLKELLEKKFV